jgi:hypothetical protein
MTPKIMLKLFMFAYATAVTSSRELERRCFVDVRTGRREPARVGIDSTTAYGLVRIASCAASMIVRSASPVPCGVGPVHLLRFHGLSLRESVLLRTRTNPGAAL